MNKLILFFACLMLSSTISFSQATTANPPGSVDSLNEVYTAVDKEAEFKGGNKEWQRYISQNLVMDTPQRNGAPDGTYQVIVIFKVSMDGKISAIQPTTNLGYGTEKAVVSLLKGSPKWEPAVRYNRKVNSLKTQAITFVVNTK